MSSASLRVLCRAQNCLFDFAFRSFGFRYPVVNDRGRRGVVFPGAVYSAAALAFIAALLPASQAYAFQQYLDAFNQRNSVTGNSTAGTVLDTCGVCHINFDGGGDRNLYGADFEAEPHNISNPNTNMAAIANIEQENSDGDDTNNIGEISNSFFPGWDCSNFTTATGTIPDNFANLVDPDNVGCNLTADPNGPYNGTVGIPVQFDSSGSRDPDGTIVQYEWDFGDGSVTDFNANPTHAYDTADSYTVSLTVTDNDGLTDTQTTTATIVPAPQDPIADPNGEYNGTEGVALTLDGSASFDPDGGVITQYDWDFGDGNTGTGVSPTHTYAVADTYTVTLTVVDDEGAVSAPATTTVTIESAICNFIVPSEQTFLAFGDVTINTTSTLAMTVTNNGLAPCTIAASVTSTNSQFTLASISPFNVAPGDSASVSVEFAPVNTGADSGIFNLTSNDANNPQSLDVSLSGNAVPLATASSDLTSSPGGAGALSWWWLIMLAPLFLVQRRFR